MPAETKPQRRALGVAGDASADEDGSSSMFGPRPGALLSNIPELGGDETTLSVDDDEVFTPAQPAAALALDLDSADEGSRRAKAADDDDDLCPLKLLESVGAASGPATPVTPATAVTPLAGPVDGLRNDWEARLRWPRSGTRMARIEEFNLEDASSEVVEERQEEATAAAAAPAEATAVAAAPVEEAEIPPPPPPFKEAEEAIAAAAAPAEEAEIPPPPPPFKAEEPADVGGRVCPICLDPMLESEMQGFCDGHIYCADCAARSARGDLRKGRVPRCPEPGCEVEITPQAAKNIFDEEDLDCYHRLTLWQNDGVCVCPKCHEGLYCDEGDDASRRCGIAICPACDHQFCVECRNPAHREVPDCDEAARLRGNRRRRRGAARAEARQGLVLVPAMPFICNMAAAATPATPAGGPSMITVTSSVSSGVSQDSVSRLEDVKRCPRCRCPVSKSDDDSCDHMICVKCRHEFCWTCMADRSVIYVHGNHHHRSTCPFYFSYSGPLDFVPDKCKVCARTGKPCKPPKGSLIDETAIAPLMSLGPLDTWVQSLMELVTLRSCRMLPG